MARGIIKAPALEQGDIVGLVAAGGPADEPNMVDAAVAAVRELGFRVRPGKNLRARNGFLAGTDQQRLSDLQDVIDDPEVKGIMFLRGGYGSLRLLQALKVSGLKKRPKVIIGSSDVTPLLVMLNRKIGLVTFHAPLALDLIKPGFADYSRTMLLNVIGSGPARYSLCSGLDQGHEPVVLSPGRARGPVIGGNLTLLTMLIGSPFEPDWRGAILALEEVNEAPYRVDRALMHLELAGVFTKIAGVALGQFSGCEDKRPNPRAEYRQSVNDVLRDRFGNLGVPVLGNLPFGHVLVNGTIPLGVEAVLDTAKADLIFQERGVCNA